MDRRSFLASLIGGLTMAGLGGTAMAASRTEPDHPAAAPPQEPMAEVDAAALDRAEADYAQYYYYRRRPYYGRRRYSRRRYYRRPYGYYGRPYGYRRRRYPYRRGYDWRARNR